MPDSSACAPRRPASRRLALGAITTAGLLWGTSGVLAQLVHRSAGMGPMEISFWRLAISSVALTAVALPGLRHVVAAGRRSPGTFLAAGAALGAYQGLFFVAVTTAGVTIATMVSLGAAPVVAALWESFRRRRLPGVRASLVIAVAIVGLVLVAGGRGVAAGPEPALGVLAALASGVVYGAEAILGRHLAQHTPSVAMTTITSFVGAACLLPFVLLAQPAVRPADAPLRLGVAWGGLVTLGVLTTAVAYLLFNHGLRATESSVAAVVTLVEPLAAAVLAVTVLSEPLGVWTVVGAGLLLGAVAMLYLTPGTGREEAGGVPSGTPPTAAAAPQD